MALTVVDQSVLALTNTICRVSVNTTDHVGTLVDPFSITARLMDLGGTVILEDTWTSLIPGTRIVRPSLGKFYVNLGDVTPNVETNSQQDLMLDWEIELVSGGSINHSVQKIKIITIRAASYLPEFKLLIDKTRKLVDTNEECFLGYTDSQLYSYLEGGLGTINAYQPTLFFSMDNYPLEQKMTLLEAGLIMGTMSQQLFAIDSDLQSYSDNGVSYVLQHQPQLAAFLNQVTQRLDKIIPMMKQCYVSSGALHVSMGPNFKLNTLMQSSPSGSLFRNMFVSG